MTTKKKRFTFADAKSRIAELEAELKGVIQDAKLNQDDNIYDKGEQKFIKIYKVGFWVLLVVLLFGGISISVAC